MLKKSKSKQSNVISLQALEQRFLLDGAAVATIADAAISDSTDHDLDAAIELLPVSKNGLESDSSFELSATINVIEGSYSAEIVFIDGAVGESASADVEDLLNSIDQCTSLTQHQMAYSRSAQLSATIPISMQYI